MSLPPKKIHDTLILTPNCRERFIDLRHPGAQPLEAHHLQMAGMSDFAEGYEVGRVNSFHHLALITLTGRGRFFSSSREFYLEPGEILLVPAGETYGYVTAEATWRTMWFHLEDHEYWGKLRERGIDKQSSFTATNLEHAVEGYISESSRSNHAARRAAHLFADLIGHYLEIEVEGEDDPVTKRYQEMLYGLWDVVDANLQNNWTVEALAAHLHMSPVHFHRICMKYSNRSPMKMVTFLRMQRAEEMIKNGYPLKVIAEVVGYQNVFAFSVAFKRHAGCSPRDFKKLL